MPTSSSLLQKLWFRVLLGLLLGIAFGFLVGPQYDIFGQGVDGSKAFLTDYIKPIGTLFLHLIMMVIVPLIFFSLINGIVSMTDAEAFKRIGLKSVAAYLMTGAFAVCIGLTFGHVFRPGDGVDLSSLNAISGNSAAAATSKEMNSIVTALNTIAGNHALPPAVTNQVEVISHSVSVLATPPVKKANIIDILVDTVPPNVIEAMATDHILQVVVFALFVGVALNKLGAKVQNLTDVCRSAATLVFRLIDTVIKFSPYGVFALTAWMVGTQGMPILKALLTLVCVVIGALFTQYLLFGLMVIIFGRMSPLPFYKKMLEPQLLAFSTSSSKATLSTAMRVVNERIGVSKTSTSFVLPLGASINMDGTAIYLGITALFFSQAYNIPLDAHHYFILILTATLGSIGAAGIPSGSLFMMGMVFTSVGLPLDGIALIAGVDRVLDMMRTTVNITGDSVITMLVDKSEGTFDKELYQDMER